MRETEHTFRLGIFLFFLPKRIVKSISQKAETKYTICFFFFFFFILTETDYGIRVGGGWNGIWNPFWCYFWFFSETECEIRFSV